MHFPFISQSKAQSSMRGRAARGQRYQEKGHGQDFHMILANVFTIHKAILKGGAGREETDRNCFIYLGC